MDNYDLDYPDQHSYIVDDIDYSSPSQDDISDTFDYTEDNFFDHDYGHDLMYDIYPLPCSPTSQTLDNPSCSLSTSSDNLHLNKEMSTKTLHTTACTAIGKDHNPDTDSLEVQTYMILPDYAGIVLPPLTNTVYTLNDSRFKYPSKSSPTPKCMLMKEQTSKF